jgi:hypothetical protein
MSLDPADIATFRMLCDWDLTITHVDYYLIRAITKHWKETGTSFERQLLEQVEYCWLAKLRAKMTKERNLGMQRGDFKTDDSWNARQDKFAHEWKMNHETAGGSIKDLITRDNDWRIPLPQH